MNITILKAVARFTTLRAGKNYKLSTLVKLCEGRAASNADITSEDDFVDFLFDITLLPHLEELVLVNGEKMFDDDLYINFQTPVNADKFIAVLKEQLHGVMDGISLIDKENSTEKMLVIQEIMRRLNLKPF